MSNNSTENVISRIVALDGIAFNTFCTSKDLRALMQKSDHQVPNSPNTIREIVLKTAKTIKDELKREFSELKAADHKFTISFDEWTSVSNKRYMNRNVHYLSKDNVPVFANLGLIRIQGSMRAEQCIDMLKKRLGEFSLSLECDIVALVTDGCSLMKKVGYLLPCIHQVYLAHGMQLAILEVLYKTKPTATPITDVPQAPQLNYTNSDTDNDTDSEDIEGFNVSVEPHLPSQQDPDNLRLDYDLIKRVRKVVKIFKKSPVKNAILQTYVKQELGKELQVAMDCKTRWSSLADMLERFLKLKSAITKALIDIKSEYHSVRRTSTKLNRFLNASNCSRIPSKLFADVTPH